MIDELERRILLGKHTRRQFRERMESGELRACIIPVAATEQHLEHLAMEFDWASCRHVALEVARRLDPQVIVAPVMQLGISQHHMRHPGTLSASPGSWLGVLLDAIQSMKQAGFSNILVLNGHGGNIAPCLGVWDQFLQHTEINLHFQSYWDFLDDEVARAHLETGRFPGHAQEFETALALAVFPESVDQNAIVDQPDSEPRAASAEAGAAMLESIVGALQLFVSGIIAGTQQRETPAFH